MQKSFGLITDDKKDASLSLKLLSLAIYKYQHNTIIIISDDHQTRHNFKWGGERGASMNEKKIRQRVGAEFPGGMCLIERRPC